MTLVERLQKFAPILGLVARDHDTTPGPNWAVLEAPKTADGKSVRCTVYVPEGADDADVQFQLHLAVGKMFEAYVGCVNGLLVANS
jgi:hypothetical protein